MKELNENAAWSVIGSSDMIHSSNKKDDLYLGYVYAVEFGSFLKIGQTRNLAQRMVCLRGLARNYAGAETGLVVYSPKHTNFLENESILHRSFDRSRVSGGELFDLSLNDFMLMKPPLEYKDDSVALEKRTTDVTEVLKSMCLNGPSSRCCKGQQQPNADIDDIVLDEMLRLLTIYSAAKSEMIAFAKCHEKELRSFSGIHGKPKGG